MTSTRLAKILILSLGLAALGRLATIEFQSWKNERLTADLCVAAGNYLETGNLREAFESLEYGASRVSTVKACVSVLDNGRSFAPNCVDEKATYQTVTCRAEANRGVRALVMYPKGKLFDGSLLTLWLCVALILSLLLISAQTLVAYISAQLVQELQATTLGTRQPEKKNVSGRFIEAVLARTGIHSAIHAQAEGFEEKIKAYELRLVSEAEMREQREFELERSRDHSEKIKKIRHDIRSPLSGLLAVQEAMGSSDELMRSTIASVVGGLRDLVEKLGNLEAEEDAPSLTIVEVVAEEALSSTRLKFQKAKSVSIALHYDREKLSPVFAVPGALRRVFENLLENAFDAVSPGGLIEIAIGGGAKECRIIIEDNGCGIAAEKLPLLFQEGATFGKIGGTGLGLYQAKRSLQSWGGAIAFESREGGGARFALSVPLAQTGVVYKAPPPPPHEVFLIDDDSKTENLLVSRGYKIVGNADSFDQSVDLLKRARASTAIVLIDQDLAGRKGTDLIAETSNRLGFFLCTNEFDNEDVVRRARQVGVSIIPKPLLMAAPQATRKSPIMTHMAGFKRISDHRTAWREGDTLADRL